MSEGVIIDPAPQGKSPLDYKSDVMFLAMILEEIKRAKPKGAEEAERLVRDIWYAVGLAANVGYPVGVDRWGYAHIQLPFANPKEGLLTFAVGRWEGENPAATPHWLASTRSAIETYHDAVRAHFAPERY